MAWGDKKSAKVQAKYRADQIRTQQRTAAAHQARLERERKAQEDAAKRAEAKKVARAVRADKARQARGKGGFWS